MRRRHNSGLGVSSVTFCNTLLTGLLSTHPWKPVVGAGTSMVCDGLRSFLSVDMSANLAKSVSWSARRADFLDSSRRMSSILFLTSCLTPVWGRRKNTLQNTCCSAHSSSTPSQRHTQHTRRCCPTVALPRLHSNAAATPASGYVPFASPPGLAGISWPVKCCTAHPQPGSFTALSQHYFIIFGFEPTAVRVKESTFLTFQSFLVLPQSTLSLTQAQPRLHPPSPLPPSRHPPHHETLASHSITLSDKQEPGP